VDWKDGMQLGVLIFLFLVLVIAIVMPAYWQPEKPPLQINVTGMEVVELNESVLIWAELDCIKWCQANEHSSEYQLRMCYEACERLGCGDV
jgi:hypothetical protein